MRWDEMEGGKMEKRLLVILGAQDGGIRKGKK